MKKLSPHNPQHSKIKVSELFKPFEVTSEIDMKTGVHTEPRISQVTIIPIILPSHSINISARLADYEYSITYLPSPPKSILTPSYFFAERENQRIKNIGTPSSEQISNFHSILKAAAVIHPEVKEYLLENLPNIFYSQFKLITLR